MRAAVRVRVDVDVAVARPSPAYTSHPNQHHLHTILHPHNALIPIAAPTDTNTDTSSVACVPDITELERLRVALIAPDFNPPAV